MLDRLSPDFHGIWHVIEPLLHRIHYMFVAPSLDETLLGGCALRPECAVLAGREVAIAICIQDMIKAPLGLC